MRPTIICLTPVKNEAWILDLFLQSTSLWADYIIISDQNSTDNSIEIASKFPKVILIKNSHIKDFNEYDMRKPLIDEARKIQGKRILISLDADEIFTPDFLSDEWHTIQELKPGTIITFPWLNIFPGFKKYWTDSDNPIGFVDDEREYRTGLIHTTRLFNPSENKVDIHKSTISILHFQYVDWERMQCKHRWYQCFERIHFPQKNIVDIFRIYHHMYAIEKKYIYHFQKKWMSDYQGLGINILHFQKENKYWWEEKVLDYFDKYGVTYFRKINIWDVNWVKIAKLHKRQDPFKYNDPRTYSDKMIQLFLKATQPHQHKYIIRKIEKVIKKYFEY